MLHVTQTQECIKELIKCWHMRAWFAASLLDDCDNTCCKLLYSCSSVGFMWGANTGSLGSRAKAVLCIHFSLVEVSCSIDTVVLMQSLVTYNWAVEQVATMQLVMTMITDTSRNWTFHAMNKSDGLGFPILCSTKHCNQTTFLPQALTLCRSHPSC